MTTIAPRDLRNHTAALLKQVADGVEVTVSVNGEPAALITRAGGRRRAGVLTSELPTLLDRHDPNLSLAGVVAWISEGRRTTWAPFGDPGAGRHQRLVLSRAWPAYWSGESS